MPILQDEIWRKTQKLLAAGRMRSTLFGYKKCRRASARRHSYSTSHHRTKKHHPKRWCRCDSKDGNFVLRIYARLPLTSKLVLTAVRSRSRENNTQLFSNTLAPLRYLKSKLSRLRSGYVHRHSVAQGARNRLKSKAITAKRKEKGHP